MSFWDVEETKPEFVFEEAKQKQNQPKAKATASGTNASATVRPESISFLGF